jgi:hypothetical protein
VTAEAEAAFQWNPQGIELLILIVLILALALTAVVWRYATRFEADQALLAPSAPSETGQEDGCEARQHPGASRQARPTDGG